MQYETWPLVIYRGQQLTDGFRQQMGNVTSLSAVRLRLVPITPAVSSCTGPENTLWRRLQALESREAGLTDRARLHDTWSCCIQRRSVCHVLGPLPVGPAARTAAALQPLMSGGCLRLTPSAVAIAACRHRLPRIVMSALMPSGLWHTCQLFPFPLNRHRVWPGKQNSRKKCK